MIISLEDQDSAASMARKQAVRFSRGPEGLLGLHFYMHEIQHGNVRLFSSMFVGRIPIQTLQPDLAQLPRSGASLAGSPLAAKQAADLEMNLTCKGGPPMSTSRCARCSPAFHRRHHRQSTR